MERNRQLPAWTTGRSAQAFTLVELLCAAGLIALLSAISLPSLADVIQRYRARTAAWQVAGHLRLARAKAISNNQHHWVCFSKCGATIGSLADRFLVGVQLSAAEHEGKVRTLSSPRVATQDNEEAEIKQGTQVPFTTIDSSRRTVVSFQDAFIKLKVKPHITPDSRVAMKVEAERSFAGDRIDFTDRRNRQPLTRCRRSAVSQSSVGSSSGVRSDLMNVWNS